MSHDDQARAYVAAEPFCLGNLHERMKAVMLRASEVDLHKFDRELWSYLFDLQLEVAHHQPAKPPYGHRKCRERPGDFDGRFVGGCAR